MTGKAAIIFVVFWWLLITVISFWPAGDATPRLFTGADKLIHFLMYFVFSAALINARLLRGSDRDNRKEKLFLFAAASGYGLLMEAGQEITRMGRTFEWGDVAANTAGALLGFLVLYRKGNKQAA